MLTSSIIDELPQIIVPEHLVLLAKKAFVLAILERLSHVKPRAEDVKFSPGTPYHECSWASGNSSGNHVEVCGSFYCCELNPDNQGIVCLTYVAEDSYRDTDTSWHYFIFINELYEKMIGASFNTLEEMFCPFCFQSGYVDDNQTGGAEIRGSFNYCQNCCEILAQ